MEQATLSFTNNICKNVLSELNTCTVQNDWQTGFFKAVF